MKTSIKNLALYAVVAVVGVGVAYAAFAAFKVAPTPRPPALAVSPVQVPSVPAPAPAPAPAPVVAKAPVPEDTTPPQLILSGIFVSGGDSYVLVNNQIVRVGEEIQGATVTAIRPDEVDLTYHNTTIKLSVQ